MNYEDTDKGKCITCGFAAKRTIVAAGESPNRHYYEIPQEERLSQITLNPVTHLGMTAFGVRKTPVEVACYRHVENLPVLADERRREIASPDVLPVEAVRQAFDSILRDDRRCPKWYPHTDGVNPKEHLDEYKMQQLEQDRREFELKLFEMSQKVQEDSRAIAKDSKKIAKWLGLIIILLTVIQIALAVISYYSSNKPIVISLPVPTQEPQQH